MIEKIRLAKKIAESGIASRREAERMIIAGRVTVDGIKILTPVFFPTNENIILIDGNPIREKAKDTIIWKFNKPREVITTRFDPQQRRTVFDFFNGIQEHQRILSIGRLDFNSEGLLLFTNNGDIARKLELPSTGLKRIYLVRIFGEMTKDKIEKLQQGITVDGIHYGSINVQINNQKEAENKINFWVQVTLTEGKNREIRRVMDAVNCQVSRLIRVNYGNVFLNDLPLGEISQLSKKETKAIENL